MANRDYEIDFRLRAETDQAERALRGTEASLLRVQQAVADANAEMSSGGSGSGASEEVGAQEALTGALNANVQARQRIGEASRMTQKAISAEIGLIGEVEQRLARQASSMDDLADTEARLDAAMAKGLISTEEYDAGLAKLNKEQERLSRGADKTGKSLDASVARYDKVGAGLQRMARDEALLKKAVDAGRISREQYNRAMDGISSQRTRLESVRVGADSAAGGMRRLSFATAGAQRDLSQMLIYSARGDWQLAGNQILQMGNRAGIAGKLFSGAGLAIGATAAVVVGAGVAFTQGYLQLRAFENALISTGNSAGLTSGELASVRNEIGEATGQFGDAQKALVLLAGSGKLSGEALKSAASAAVNLSELTGKSIEETTSRIIALAESPIDGLVKLNEQYHFLTLETYDNIKSLQDQGREQDVVAATMDELAKVSQQRTDEMRANAGSLERAWVSVRGAVRGAIQAIQDAGRRDAQYAVEANNRGISARQQRINDLREDVRLGYKTQQQVAAAIAGQEQMIANQRRDNAVWQARVKTEEQANKEKAAGQKLDEDIALAAIAIDKRTLSLDKQKAKQAELNEITRQYNLISSKNEGDRRLFDGSQELARKAVEEKYKERAGRKSGPKAKKTTDLDAGAQREIDNLYKQIALLGELEDGETKVSEAARIGYEIREGIYKDSSRAAQDALVDAAQMLDQDRRSLEIAKQLKSIDLQVLTLQGKEGAAALQETLDKYRELKAELELKGRPDDAAKVQQAIDLTNSKAQIDAFAQQAQAAFDQIQREQTRIQAEQQAGLITEYEAQQRIVDLYRDKNTVLREMLPTMEAIAATMGPEAQAQVARIRAELESMAQVTNLLQQQVGGVFQGAFANALESLITQTASLREAVRGFFLDMSRGLAQMASKALAQAAWSKILSLFGKGKSDIGDGAGKLTTAAAATASAGFVLYGSAAALQASAIALAAAGAGGGSSGGSGGSGWGGILTAFLGAFTGGGGVAAASGGLIRGPGTGTSDSIPALLSDYEHVTRSAVVRQHGALPFLTDFNQRGMPAIADWARRFEGVNLPRMPAMPSVPKFRFAEGGLAQALGGIGGTQNNMRLYNLFDMDSLAQALAKHPAMEKAIVVNASENGRAIQAVWQS